MAEVVSIDIPCLFPIRCGQKGASGRPTYHRECVLAARGIEGHNCDISASYDSETWDVVCTCGLRRSDLHAFAAAEDARRHHILEALEAG